jgi:hypothetical protein
VTAVSIAFFDAERELYGTARSGATVLFAGSRPSAVAEGPRVEQSDDRLSAILPGRFELELQPVTEPAELGEVRARVCGVSGEVDGTRVDCLGTVAETRKAPAWEELDALRSVSVLVDRETALLAVSRRPRGAPGHGQELVSAALVSGGELLAVEEARISTVYDAGGRQRSAGLELHLPGEDFPRRGSGVVAAGSSLELEGLTAHLAVFRWRLEGREGVGGYDLMVREETPSAA